MPSLSLAVHRTAVLAAIVLTAVLFDTKAADPVNVIKLTALLLCALVVVLVALVRVVLERVARVPWNAASAAAAAMIAALTVAALHAPNHTVAVLGAPGRNNGWLAYVAGLTLFLVVLRAYNEGRAHWPLLALLATATFTAAYGVLQRADLDPIHWSRDFNPIIGALGNPDFASAYLGIGAPAAAWAALSSRYRTALRIAAGALGVAFLVVAALSQAVQGPLAAGAGLFVVALAVALNLSDSRRRTALLSLGAVAVAGGVLLALGMAKIGPAAHFFTGISYEARTWYWRAALTMFGRNPLIGVGLDSYNVYWFRDRPIEVPRQLGGAAFTDSAHSVPLQHLAEGGLLLVLAYLAFVVVVAASLVRGLHTRDGEARLVLGGLGGAWAAYQVQSLVSIDHVALLVLNFVLGAATIVAAGDARLREFRLRGAAVERAQQPAGKGRKPARLRQAPRRRALVPLDLALLGAMAVAGGIAAWEAFVPLRASHAAYDGAVARQAGNGSSALAHFSSAQNLVGGYGSYWLTAAETYRAGGRNEDARRLYLAAFEHDPATIQGLQNAAIISATDGDVESARRLYTQLLRLTPHDASVITGLALLDVRRGKPADALPLLEKAAQDLPGDADLIGLLGEARFAVGDVAGAKAAWERSVKLMPGQPTATAGLEKLNRPQG